MPVPVPGTMHKSLHLLHFWQVQQSLSLLFPSLAQCRLPGRLVFISPSPKDRCFQLRMRSLTDRTCRTYRGYRSCSHWRSSCSAVRLSTLMVAWAPTICGKWGGQRRITEVLVYSDVPPSRTSFDPALGIHGPLTGSPSWISMPPGIWCFQHADVYAGERLLCILFVFLSGAP